MLREKRPCSLTASRHGGRGGTVQHGGTEKRRKTEEQVGRRPDGRRQGSRRTPITNTCSIPGVLVIGVLLDPCPRAARAHLGDTLIVSTRLFATSQPPFSSVTP